MEPQIRYVRSADGVNIAWYAMGSGVPFIWPTSAQGAGLDTQWRIPEIRTILEEIARAAMLVSYDPRGFGLSDRGSMDFSLDAMVADLEAVADAAAPAGFVLQTFSYGSMVGLAYAARHPERVLALVMLNGLLRGADISASWSRLLRLFEDDWDFARTLIMQLNEAAFDTTATLAQWQTAFDKSVDKETFLRFNAEMASWDASSIVEGVHVPALVAHYGSQATYVPLSASRRLAASLPNCRFVPLDRRDDEGMTRTAARAVRRFLAEIVPAPQDITNTAPPPIAARAGTAIILFSDVADSTALTERLGDGAFRERARALDASLRSIITESGGTAIDGKLLGDGVLATFPSAVQAIDAAVRLGRAGDDAALPLHLGLHAGDVIREHDNVFGGAVNIASRISALAAPGEVLVTDVVRALARTSAGVTFEDRGEHQLKGVADPQRIFAVGKAEA